MKFTCNKDLIVKEISIAQEIISSRNSISILSNVLLEVEENTLTIRATDLKVGFETRIPVESVQSGSTTVFCDKFLSILRSLPDGDIEFTYTNDNKFIIKPLFNKIDFKLKSINADKYPELQNIDDEKYFEIAQKEIIEMISQTVFAVSDDETRYYMNGVYLEVKDNTLSMVATDGRRLSYIKAVNISGTINFDPVIIPIKILQLIKKLATGEGIMYIAVNENNIFVKFDNQKLFSNLIKGQFPNYKRVIPETQEYKIEVNRVQCIEALKRVSLLVEQKSRRIFVTFVENTIIFNSEESEIGIAKEEVSCSFIGPETTIALNYLYLVEPLKVIEDETVLIRFTEANKAITLLPFSEKNYFHIIMPMQLD